MAAGLCCSIEMEPKTLNQGELSLAMEVAADIAQTMEAKEATEAFIDGLRPVVSIQEENDQLQNEANVNHHACQCSDITAAVLESPDLGSLREPLSAPF